MSKVTDVEVSAFSECFLFYFEFFSIIHRKKARSENWSINVLRPWWTSSSPGSNVDECRRWLGENDMDWIYLVHDFVFWKRMTKVIGNQVRLVYITIIWQRFWILNLKYIKLEIDWCHFYSLMPWTEFILFMTFSFETGWPRSLLINLDWCILQWSDNKFE